MTQAQKQAYMTFIVIYKDPMQYNELMMGWIWHGILELHFTSITSECIQEFWLDLPSSLKMLHPSE